ncbi:hypothetical protein LG293_17930 (plasmid) [Citricoccus nitrophenolicus]
MSTPHTLVFIDVDGTIAPEGSTPRTLHASGWSHWMTARASGMQVIVSIELLKAMRRITAMPGVQPRWLTDWNDDVHELGHVLDLGPFPETGGSVEDDGFDYKSAVILRDLEHTGVRRFVWLDNDAPGHSRNLTPAQHEAIAPTLNATEKAVWTAGAERLIIGPRSTEGLTPADVAAVEQFCRR